MPNKTQRFTIDLERNEDAATIAADVEPGDKLKATVSVVSKDDKSLVVELDEIEEPAGSEAKDTEEEDTDADEDISSLIHRD